MNAISLDATDCRILAVLQNEGRISNLDLAERISLSPSACLRRLRLLEEQGVVEHYRACLNREMLGFEMEAFVQVSMRNDEPGWHEQFAAALREWPEVTGAYVVTGDTHYMLRVLAHNLKHYSDFVLNKLHRTPGVLDVRSIIVLQTLKVEAGVPVELIAQKVEKAEKSGSAV
jgi:DNA-binding Lrp family transcriptional regulator